MITLYGAGARFGLPEASPYVTKTEVQLKLAGLDYRKEPGRPDQSPKGQMPWIDDDGQAVGDSHFIREHIEAKYGVDLDEGLSELERAQAWAVERMLENHFNWTTGYMRWMVPENFAKGPAQFFTGLPDAVREDAQARVAANMKAQGVGRHTEAEIVGLGERSLKALSAILGDRDWLGGDRPCGADATLFGALSAAMTPFFDSPIRARAEAYPNLVAYVRRGMARWYPEHAWETAPEPVLEQA